MHWVFSKGFSSTFTLFSLCFTSHWSWWELGGTSATKELGSGFVTLHLASISYSSLPSWLTSSKAPIAAAAVTISQFRNFLHHCERRRNMPFDNDEHCGVKVHKEAAEEAGRDQQSWKLSKPDMGHLDLDWSQYIFAVMQLHLNCVLSGFWKLFLFLSNNTKLSRIMTSMKR